MLITGILKKLKFSKFLQTHFTSPIQIRMKKKLPYRVQFVMDYKKMPFRSTNFLTLHVLTYIYSAFCRSYLVHKHFLHMFNKFELSDLKCEKQLKSKFQLNNIMLKLFAISSVLVKYFDSMTKNIYVKNI